MWAMTQRLLAQMIERNMAEPIEPENAIRKACFKVRRTHSLKDKKEEKELRRVSLNVFISCRRVRMIVTHVNTLFCNE